jgi:hypothetical protein
MGFLGGNRNGTVMILHEHNIMDLYILSFIFLSFQRCVGIFIYRSINQIRGHIVGTCWDLLHLDDEPGDQRIATSD